MKIVVQANADEAAKAGANIIAVQAREALTARGSEMAWDLIQTSLNAKFSNALRHVCRCAKKPSSRIHEVMNETLFQEFAFTITWHN